MCACTERWSPSFSEVIIDTISSVDLAHDGVAAAKDWLSVDCGTICLRTHFGRL